MKIIDLYDFDFVGDISNTDLPLQYKQPGCDLSGHSKGQLESCSDYLQSVVVHLFPSNRL